MAYFRQDINDINSKFQIKYELYAGTIILAKNSSEIVLNIL